MRILTVRRQARLAGRSVGTWLALATLLAIVAGCDRKPEPSRKAATEIVTRRDPPPPAPTRPSAAPQLHEPPPAQTLPTQTVATPFPVETEHAEKLPLRVYDLRMDGSALARLERNSWSKDRYPSTFVVDGQTYEGAQARFRGQWSRSWPKKAFKIFFADDRRFEDHSNLNLNSAWRDPAFIREVLAYRVYAACGVPASRSRMVRLNVNGQFRGLFVEVEQPDKAFLHRWGLKGATLYKSITRSNLADERDLGSPEAYAQQYERQSKKEEGYAELHAFCRELARAADVADFFERRVDVEKYVNYLAATVLTQNWDCYNKNHFMACDTRGSGKWFAIPWDLDRTFGDHWNMGFGETRFPVLQGTRQHPGITGWNRMADRFLSHPGLRDRFLNRLQELLETEFTREKLFPEVDRNAAQISAEAARDRQRWPSPAGDLRAGIAGLKRFIENRRSFLLQEVARLRHSAPARSGG